MLICLLPKIFGELVIIAVLSEKVVNATQAAIVFVGTLRHITDTYWIPNCQKHMSDFIQNSARLALADHSDLSQQDLTPR